MKNQTSIELWKKANELFEIYIDLPLRQALEQIDKDQSIPTEVKKRLISLVKSKEFDTTSADDAHLDYFNSINNSVQELIGESVGQWKVIKLLGEGGMSTVYLVERNAENLNQKAALKIIPHALVSQTTIERFIRERQILSDLNHNNIAKLYDAGVRKNNAPWLVMELVEGNNIIEYVENNQLNVKQKVLLFTQACKALAYAHSQGVIHRDIKPSNVMVNNDKVLKLLDFGIAAVEQQQSLTATGAVIGTPGYMSPEQAKGISEKLDPRTDIFSLGVLFYKLIKNEMPFEADNISETNHKIINQEPALIGSDIHVDLQAIIFKCLEKKAGDRYQTVSELNNDLMAYYNGDVVSARKITLIGRFQKLVTKNPRASLFFLIATLAVIVAISYALYQSFSSSEKIRTSEKFLFRAQEIKSKVRRIHMMPLHNIKSEYETISAEIEQLKKEIERAGADDSGLSDFALGSAYLSMKKSKLALKYLKIAERKGWKSVELSSALGKVLSLRLGVLKEESESLKDEAKKEKFLIDIQENIYIPAIKHLNEAQKGVSTSNYISAILAQINNDFDKAIEYINKEIIVNPWHYEAVSLGSNLYSQKAIQVLNAEGINKAKFYLDKSNELMDRALRVGASDPYNYIDYCAHIGFEIQVQLQYRTKSLLSVFNKGLEVCENALLLVPFQRSIPAIYQNIIYLYTAKADYQHFQEVDNVDTYVEANRIAQKALGSFPNHAGLLTASIEPLEKLAKISIKNNTNPTDYYKLAIINLEKSLSINPNIRKSWYQFAILQKSLGNYYRDTNEYTLANDHYEQAILAQLKVKELGNNFSSLASMAIIYQEQAKLNIKINKPLAAIKLFEKSLLLSEEIFDFNNEVFVIYANYFEFQFDLVNTLSINNLPYSKELGKAIKTINHSCSLDIINQSHIKLIELSIKPFVDSGYAQVIDFSICQQKITLLQKTH